MENKYRLVDEYRFDYFPSSANQTPIIWLLQVSFYETLDFIIGFTNKAVESYRNSDDGKKDVIQVTLQINETEVIQYLNNDIWCMYRGNVGNSLHLLQSIHMALEKILLNSSQILQPEIMQEILLKILTRSKNQRLLLQLFVVLYLLIQISSIVSLWFYLRQ